MISTLNHSQIALLEPGLIALAEYHNTHAATFAGIYPIIPLDTRLAELTQEVTADKATVMAVMSDIAVVAFCVVLYKPGDSAMIEYLFVDEAHRKHGYGKMLLTEAENLCRKKGIKRIDLNVVNGNPAYKFYTHSGYLPRLTVVAKSL